MLFFKHINTWSYNVTKCWKNWKWYCVIYSNSISQEKHTEIPRKYHKINGDSISQEKHTEIPRKYHKIIIGILKLFRVKKCLTIIVNTSYFHIYLVLYDKICLPFYDGSLTLSVALPVHLRVVLPPKAITPDSNFAIKWRPTL